MKATFLCFFTCFTFFDLSAQTASCVKFSTGLNASFDAKIGLNGHTIPDKEAKTYRINLPSVAITFLHNKRNSNYFEAAYNNYELKKYINQSNGKMDATTNTYKGMLDMTYNLQTNYIKKTAFRMGLGFGTSLFIDRSKCSAFATKSSYTRIHSGFTTLIVPKIQYWFSDQNFIEMSLPMRTLWFGMVSEKNYSPTLETPQKWNSKSVSSAVFTLPPNYFHIGIGYQFGSKKVKKLQRKTKSEK